MNDASIDELIDGLADELKPVPPKKMVRGLAWTAAGWVGGAVLLLWLYGMRHDLAAGGMPALSMLSFWLIAATGVAAAWSALRMGLPGVGRDYSGWRWAVLAALSLPLAALLLAFGDTHAAIDASHGGLDAHCLSLGIASGLGVGAALFLWLRSGAPTSPARAGWVIGLASGAAGATIVALHCADDNLIHIALWHGLAVVISALAGRLILPRFLRW
jgi:hypothetical protein